MDLFLLTIILQIISKTAFEIYFFQGEVAQNELSGSGMSGPCSEVEITCFRKAKGLMCE